MSDKDACHIFFKDQTVQARIKGRSVQKDLEVSNKKVKQLVRENARVLRFLETKEVSLRSPDSNQAVENKREGKGWGERIKMLTSPLSLSLVPGIFFLGVRIDPFWLAFTVTLQRAVFTYLRTITIFPAFRAPEEELIVSFDFFEATVAIG